MEGRLGIWNLHMHTAIFKINNWNFPSGPGVKNPSANAGYMSSIPGLGRFSHAWNN